ncbi:MAG TPA: NFACT RNA binding domain-containing protein, partial [Armatimonadota bacterium]|nr:NFACT RNA binding domain-containing protein [Armatimonadota bacterium]
ASIKKGETIAKVVDYYNPEMKEIEIPLDEKLSTQENAERYFRRYRKAIEGANAAADRQKEFQEEIKELKSAAEKLPSIESIEDIQALREMLTQKGLLRPEPLAPVPGKREEPEFGTARIRRVTSSNGFEILYGENSQSNDYLTSKVAKPNDLWFHARSVTGAHVVIRTGNRPDLVPRSTIMQAAEIAARNSDAKHSRLVAVDYTLKKYVRKPKGSPPGFVRYQQEKTIDVVPDVK